MSTNLLETIEQAKADGILPVCELEITPEHITIEYPHYVYDDLLTDSNMAAMQSRLDGLDGYGMVTLHEYNIDVLDSDGAPTAAFTELCAICDALQNYCVLDEDDLEAREHVEAREQCMTAYGDDLFAEWRAGKLGLDNERIASHVDRSAYPSPAQHPDMTELPDHGPVYSWIYDVAYAKYREYI